MNIIFFVLGAWTAIGILWLFESGLDKLKRDNWRWIVIAGGPLCWLAFLLVIVVVGWKEFKTNVDDEPCD